MIQLLLSAGSDFDAASVAALPAGCPRAQGCLYVLEFSNGLIKVGRSASPRSRITQHAASARQYGGAALLRGWLSAPHRDVNATEVDLIAFARARADRCEGREFLHGVSFDDLVWFADGLMGHAPDTDVILKLRTGCPDATLLDHGPGSRVIVTELATFAYEIPPDRWDQVRILPAFIPETALTLQSFDLHSTAQGLPLRLDYRMLHGVVAFAEPAHLDKAKAAWSRMWDAAARGEEALELIRRA